MRFGILATFRGASLAGSGVEGTTADLSTSGLAAQAVSSWPLGEQVEIGFPEEEDLTERLHGQGDRRARGPLADPICPDVAGEQKLLTRVLYSRADRWLDGTQRLPPDNPVRSLFSVLRVLCGRLLEAAIHGPWRPGRFHGQAIEAGTGRRDHRPGAGGARLRLSGERTPAPVPRSRAKKRLRRLSNVFHPGLTLQREGNVSARATWQP